jgi:hypothetical protein
MPARPLAASGSVKILVCSASGWGKTRLAGTSRGPKGKSLFIRPPVDYTDSVNPEDKPFWEEWVVADWTQMEECFEMLRHEGREKYDWVWFDSISGYQDIGLDDLWVQIIDEKPARKRWGMDKGDYWINMQRLGRWVRDVATLSDTGAFNFGITAWPKELSPSPDDVEVGEKLMPWVQGKNMAMKTCGYVNVVAFGDFTEKGTRQLHFMEDERVYAKCQFDGTNAPGSVRAMNYRMLRPTMPKIMKMIEASGGPGPQTKPTRAKTRRRRVAATKGA